MLTVLYKDDLGNEEIIAASKVKRCRQPGGDVLLVVREDGTDMESTTGSCFVMNEKGATVATYHLGPPNQLHPFMNQMANPKAPLNG